MQSFYGKLDWLKLFINSAKEAILKTKPLNVFNLAGENCFISKAFYRERRKIVSV